MVYVNPTRYPGHTRLETVHEYLHLEGPEP